RAAVGMESRPRDDGTRRLHVAAPLVSLTLVVPTYRRPSDLLRCLASVQAQTLPEFEVVVVDNAADSRLEAAVTQFNTTARIAARYGAEPHWGFHTARHAGLRAAGGDVLVFTDDDATFDPGWLAAYARRFEAYPDMAAAGGPARPVWDAPPPDWVPAYM